MATPADTYITNRNLIANLPDNFDSNMSVNLTPTINATTDLLNKIGLINIIRAPNADNPFARFMGTTMPYGRYVENISIGEISAQKFNPTSCNRVFTKTPLKSWYGEINDEYEYKTSVTDVELRMGVHDSVGLANISQGIIDALRAWYNNDFVYKFANQFARISTSSTDENGYTGGYETIAVGTSEAPVDDNTVATNLLLAIRRYVREFKGLRTTFNKLGVPMNVPSSVGVTVIMTGVMWDQMREALGQVYHQDNFDIPADIVLVDSLPTPAGNLGEIGALVIDPRVLLYHLQWMNIESERCVSGRFTNYSLAGRGVFNFLWGYNAVAITLGPTAKEYTATPIDMS